MIDACRRFAGKYPNLTLLICGLVLCLSAIEVGMNMKTLVENDIIPDRLLADLKNYGWMIVAAFQLAAFLIGTILIALSALRGLGRKKIIPISDHSATQD